MKAKILNDKFKQIKLRGAELIMKYKRKIGILVLLIAVFSIIAAGTGIFSDQGPGQYTYKSIRGEDVMIYGKGLYKHMSAEVAIQGIAQDYITLFLAVPLLLIAFYFARKGSLKARLFIAGILSYFLVTYVFYLIMAMYNALFLVYAFLLGSSFFALVLTMFSFDINKLEKNFQKKAPVKFAGGFLIFNAMAIAFLWLSIVIPPLLAGTIYPVAVEHYTTLIVQGMDLGLLLPLSVVTGVLLRRKKPLAYLLGPVYLVFLSLLMTALTAKITAMGMEGYSIIPAIFIIPTFAVIAVVLSYLLINNVKEKKIN